MARTFVPPSSVYSSAIVRRPILPVGRGPGLAGRPGVFLLVSGWPNMTAPLRTKLQTPCSSLA
eukprot:scaffold251958_cov38-Tisochrysis_lutea.AAC.1